MESGCGAQIGIEGREFNLISLSYSPGFQFRLDIFESVEWFGNV
jgi:hypothetical protein